MFRSINLRVVLMAVLAAVLLMPGTSDARKMELFLDVCNSYEGESKLEAIKEGLAGYLRENPNIDVKINMFGFPLQGDNNNKLMAVAGRADRVTTTASLFNSLSQLPASDTVYVIISGGKGNWDEIKTLLRERESLKLQVVGLSLPSPDHMYRLLGVASASGGKYYNADSGDSLKGVLTKISNSAGYNLEVKVFKNKHNELTDYLVSRYKYVWSGEVYESGKRDKAIQSTNIFPARFNLPSGTYDVKVKYGNNVKWIEGVKISNWNLTEKVVNFAKGRLFVKIFNSGHEKAGVDKRANYCWWAEAYEAGKRGEPVEVTKTFPPEFNLVNGKYDIKVHYRGYDKWFYNVNIDENTAINLEHTFPHAEACNTAANFR